MTESKFSGLRPYYLMLTFWGEKYRNYFYTFCLPSLLSPNNLPVLQHVKGSKLIISTTQDDWEALKKTRLFALLRTYVEPYFIDIGYPPADVPVQWHMSKGHLLAARKAYDDFALAGFLAPDLIVSDGMVKNVMAAVTTGKKAVLAQALRFAMEPVVQELEVRGLMKPDVPITLPPRLLGSLATKSLHSEIARYDFDGPYYEHQPIWSYWKVPQRNCIVMHTVSWALLMGDYEQVPRYRDKFLKNTTIDGFYVYENFACLRDTGEMQLFTDSDEIMFMSLTPESELHYPFVEQPSYCQPDQGYKPRLRDMRRFLESDVLDPFRCWAYQVPVFIHGDELDAKAIKTAMKSMTIVATASYGPIGSQLHVPASLRWLLKIRWMTKRGRLDRLVRTLRGNVVPLVVPLVVLVLGKLPRPVLRVVMWGIPRPFVRSILYRLPRRSSILKPIARRLRQNLRNYLGPWVVPVLGGLPRPILKLALWLVPHDYVRPVVYRLSHPSGKEWIPLRRRRRVTKPDVALEILRKGPSESGRAHGETRGKA